MSLNGLLNQLAGGLGQLQNAAKPQTGGGFSGGQMAGAAAASGLAGLLLGGKSGRKMAKNVAIYGGLAGLGALAYRAYSDHKAGRAAVPAATADMAAPRDGRFLPPPGDTAAEEKKAAVLVRAMIAAAKADGHIDETERQRILGQVDALGLEAPDREFLFAELTGPLDVAAVAAGADSEETAMEIYAASLLCIDIDSVAERRYLDDLARRLRLDPGLARSIEAHAAR